MAEFGLQAKAVKLLTVVEKIALSKNKTKMKSMGFKINKTKWMSDKITII